MLVLCFCISIICLIICMLAYKITKKCCEESVKIKDHLQDRYDFFKEYVIKDINTNYNNMREFTISYVNQKLEEMKTKPKVKNLDAKPKRKK